MKKKVKNRSEVSPNYGTSKENVPNVRRKVIFCNSGGVLF
jgi:hypothetical protein